MAEEVVRRRTRLIELVVAGVLLTGLALFGLWKMDYLKPATAHHVRMTDNSRSAYVAKNIVDGKGYTTNELPAFSLDFYDQVGKLHTDNWPNADRFPFTTWAIAALYTVTGSTSWQLGILGYNAICFVAFYLLLFWLARVIWNDRWAALATLGIALLHPLAYVYPLYMKDADMMFLTTGVMAAFYWYFTRGPDNLSWKFPLAAGTMFAWLFLDRPNIGGGFIACFAVIALHRGWVLQRDLGWSEAIKAIARREGLVAVVVIAWCLPFAIHSLSEWGAPFFSANAQYQRPLGTRFAMDTDTWFKYSEPGHPVTLATLAEQARGQLISKFTSSWVMTLRVILRSFAIELILGLGVVTWLSRGASRSPDPSGSARTRDRAFVSIAKIVGVVTLLNFAVLPMYGYQNYPYRHYLSFCIPLLWLACGQGIVLIVRALRPAAARVREHVRAHAALCLLFVVIAVLVWNFGAKAQDANQMFARTASFVGARWLMTSIVLAVVVFHRALLRIPAFPLAAVVTVVLVFARFQPFFEIKSNNLNWFPADEKVWDVLREREGLVMSFALQGEVNWVSGRKNIPAPELAMHVYSFLYDHKLEVEDVYIESAETMIGPYDGPFYAAAPGFESYTRLEKYQGRLPGYEIVYHSATTKTYPKYRVRIARPKASTVYRLKDRDAVRAFARSPKRLELGRVENVVHTAHGFGDYFTIDGKPVVAATDVTKERYTTRSGGLRPFEETSVTFFLDDRRPTSVELEVFAPRATILTFFWNLDLYYYDAAADRPKHQIGKYTVEKPGWQRIRLEVPRALTRTGINKLGFDVSTFGPVTVCPPSLSQDACGAVKLNPRGGDVTIVRDEHVASPTSMNLSIFLGALDFQYDAATSN